MTEKTHWKKLMNKDYLGSWDFTQGEEKIVTIKNVSMGEVIDSNTFDKKQKPILHFIENVKPVVMNSTNAKRMTELFKSPHIEDWQGKRIILVVERFKAFGKMDEGVRIKQQHAPQAQQTAPHPIICEECKNEVMAIGEYSAQQIAAVNKKKYDVVLCGICSKKRKESEGVNDATE